MNAFLTTLACLGLLAVTVGGIMLAVAAFRTSIAWGLMYLFLPFAAFVYLFVHWKEAKLGFMTSLVGFVLAFGAAYSIPEVRGMFGQVKALSYLKPAPVKDITAQIEEQRELIGRLEAELAQSTASVTRQFHELGARRKALLVKDAAAVAKFNEDTAAYQAQNLKMRETQLILNAASQKLSELLAQRSQKKEGASIGSSGSSGREVVMYTTPTCGACKMAKRYFASKGVSYREIDVQNSPEAQAEFRKLGGRGVPLIIIAGTQMEGFNQPALDALL